MKKDRRRWLAWVIGGIVLALILIHVSHSREWRSFSWRRVGSMLLNASPELVVFAFLLSIASYAVRAYRWKYFVDPIKRCSPWILFNGQVIGFASIYLIGRAAEIVRPAYIARAESLPFTSQLAVWVIERVYDCIALVVLFALALYFEPLRASMVRRPGLVHAIHAAAAGILLLSILGVACLAAYRFYSRRIIARLEVVLKPDSSKTGARMISFLQSFSSGLDVIQSPGDFSVTVALTVLLWSVNVSVLWLTIRAVGSAATVFPWWAAALTAVLSAAGLAIQLPGVGGGSQVAMLLALKDIYHLPAADAASATILGWVVVMVPCIALGLILVFAGGLSFHKLRVITEEEEREVASPES